MKRLLKILVVCWGLGTAPIFSAGILTLQVNDVIQIGTVQMKVKI